MGGQRATCLVAPHHDDVVGGSRPTELLRDRIDDGVGRHGPRQPAQDPGERLGLTAATGLEIPDEQPVDDRRGPGHHDHDEQGAIRERGIG
jgi:hypothetical protein